MSERVHRLFHLYGCYQTHFQRQQLVNVLTEEGLVIVRAVDPDLMSSH